MLITVAETEVFSGNSPDPDAWTDLDLSGTIGANAALVLLKFDAASDLIKIAVRKNGDTDEFHDSAGNAYGCAYSHHNDGVHTVLLVATDDTGKIEWYAGISNMATTIDIIAFWK